MLLYSLKRGSRWPIECYRSSDWKQTFGPIASRHASRVDLAAELLGAVTVHSVSFWSLIGTGNHNFFRPQVVVKRCKTQRQNWCCEACETARGKIVSHDQVLVSENSIATSKIHEMLPQTIYHALRSIHGWWIKGCIILYRTLSMTQWTELLEN